MRRAAASCGTSIAGLVLLLAGSAAAQCSSSHCSVTGGPGQGVSLQVGFGLPIPAPLVNPTPPPLFSGTQMAQPAPNLVSGVGSQYGSIRLPAGLFRFAPQRQTVPVFRDNIHVFQVATSFGLSFPSQAASFAAGGRTGPRTVYWCPHLPLPTLSYNPFCSGPASLGAITNGILRYRGTARQFGGPALGRLTTGVAEVALNVAFTPGCAPASAGACRVGHVLAYGVVPGEIGGPFGTQSGAGKSAPVPIPTGHVIAMGGLGFFGTILSVSDTFLFPLGFTPTNAATSWGGPWTTGVLQVSVTAAANGVERFTLTGSNARSSMGDGTISLVAGAVSDRTLSGPNANRGLLSFTIPEPGGQAGAGVALAMLVACRWLLRRRGASST